MQNSLDRIFEGLETTLRTIVAPTISDSYILTQVTSVAEIIGNLSTRVEWRSDQLLEVINRVRPVLERARSERLPRTAELLARPVPRAEIPNAELVAARDDHLLALREVQRSLDTQPDDDLEAAIREVIAWQVAHEVTLLRTGMFSTPKPKTEEVS